MLSQDKAAIDRTLSGDRAAFAELVERHQRRLLGLLLHACGDRQLAEDVAQETFARAFLKLELFNGESQFFTWLARIGMNQLSSSLRKKRLENQLQREGMEAALDSVGQAVSPGAAVEQVEVQQAVRSALELLDEQRRAVIVLRDFDGMDYEDIAETLEIPVGTVRSRLHRGRLELKMILQRQAVELGLSDS